jgi:hypothetical protein
MRLLGRSDLALRGRNARFHFRQALWEPGQALANSNQAQINGLQFNECF